MKAATLKDVARIAGVSTATASRVLNDKNLVAPDLREKVLNAADKLRYAPHLGARSLVTHRTNIIGILLDLDNSNKASMFTNALGEICARHAISLLISYIANGQELKNIIRNMAGRSDVVFINLNENQIAELSKTSPKGLQIKMLNDYDVSVIIDYIVENYS